jgi:hypothetical protein
MGQSRAPANPVLSEFAGKFLGSIYEDGAVVPETLSASAPGNTWAADALAPKGVLKVPAWLNLGFAQSRMALLRPQWSPQNRPMVVRQNRPTEEAGDAYWQTHRDGMADAADLKDLSARLGNRRCRTAQIRGTLKWQSRAKPGETRTGKV